METARIEGISERGALCRALEAEFRENFPVDHNKLSLVWSAAWAAGSEKIDMELQSLLVDKDPNMDVMKHIPTFRDLVDAHVVQGGKAGSLK